MSARALITVLGAGLLALGGCSLVKLSDDIVQGHCQKDSDCDELNDPSAMDYDPCQRWQCNTAEKLCRYGALDADHDGQTPGKVMQGSKQVTCERDEAKQDCNDDDEDIGAGKPELCDEHDNDCDGISDEGVLEPDSTRVVVFDGDDAASQLVAARDPMSGSVALGYGLLQGVDARPGVSLLDPALAESTSASPLTIANVSMAKASQVAVAPLDGGRFAYALRSDTGMHPMIAGVWRTTGSQIGVDPDIAQLGVPCLEGESCAGVLAPVLAAQEREVMLAYLRFAGTPESVTCGQLRESGSSADVIANLLVRPSAKEVLEPGNTSVLSVGVTSDLSPPALLSLPAIGSAEASYLIGYSNERGNVVIDRVRAGDKLFVVDQKALITVDDGAAPTSSVVLALGPVVSDDEGGQVIGIAHQRGCGSAARVFVDLRKLTDGGGGKLAVEVVASALMVGGAPNQSTPALAYSAERDAWLAVYRDLNALRAVVLGPEGDVYGDGPYELIARVKAANGDEVEVLPLAPAVFDLDAGFATIAHVLRADEDSPRAFEAIHLGCGGK